MLRKKTIEGFEMAFVMFLLMACIVWLGKLIYDSRYLAIVIIILSVPCFHIILKYKPALFGLKYPDLLLCFLFLNVFCCFMIISQNGRHIAYIKKLFLSGKVVHQQALTESDEGNEYYETYYRFQENNRNETASSIIGWTLLIVCVGVIAINYRYVTIAQKLLPEKKNEILKQRV